MCLPTQKQEPKQENKRTRTQESGVRRARTCVGCRPMCLPKQKQEPKQENKRTRTQESGVRRARTCVGCRPMCLPTQKQEPKQENKRTRTQESGVRRARTCVGCRPMCLPNEKLPWMCTRHPSLAAYGGVESAHWVKERHGAGISHRVAFNHQNGCC